MNCKKTTSLLLAMRDGLLDARTQAGVQAHLDGCPACRQVEAQMLRVYHTVPAVSTDAIPAPNWARLRGRIGDHRPSRRLKYLAPSPRFVPAMGAALCLILGFLAGLWLSTAPASQTDRVARANQTDPEQTLLSVSPLLSTQTLYASYAGLEVRP